MYGPHIANMVLCALARLNLVVSSTTCASDSSQIDHVILEITSLGAPEICCHRSGATSVDRQSTFTASDHREVPVAQGHWQSVESAAFRSWPFKIPSARVDQLHVSFFSKLFILTLGGTLRPSWFEAPIECRPLGRFGGGRFAETSYRASTGWAARGQGAILSDDGRRWRLCFGIERMLTVRRDGVMV